MSNTFDQFIERYTESFGDNKLQNDLIDSLKKQYEMYCVEQDAVELLHKRYGFSVVKRKQLMPCDFDCLNGRNEINNSKLSMNDFWYNMKVNNTFKADLDINHVYAIEGISTIAMTAININKVLFYINDELVCAIVGFQIDETYYLASPFLVLP